MNLRKPKLARLVDSTKSTAINSIVHDLDKFTAAVQTLIDRHESMIVDHYTKEKVLERIHKITDVQDIMNFQLNVIPHTTMDAVAASIDELYPKEPTYVQVQMYLETLTQLSKGGSDYVREQLRQRIQKLVSEQSQAAGKIIVPPNIIT